MASFRAHRSLPMACIYFFFNRFDFFPEGLLVTAVLSPFFYVWLLRKKKRFVLEPLLLILAPFGFVNYIDGGMNWKDYVISFLLIVTVYTTVYAFAVRLQEIKSFDKLVRPLIWINFAFALIGLAVRFTSWYPYMWQTQAATGLIRYRMFTYEPAHYALTITPLVLYAYWQLVQKKSWRNFRLLVATVFPFLMAASFGAIGSLGAGILASQIILHRHLRQTKWFVAGGLLCLAGYAALPSTNHIKVRIDNILTGNDSSAKVRTTASYAAAWAIAREKDIWFGVGVGQVKLFVQGVADWGGKSPRLASGMADNLAEFGIVGIVLRFVLEAIFFFKGRPYKDPYRFSLFVSVFLLQFGAGTLSDPVEYFAFVIAFSNSLNLFPMPVPVRRVRATFHAAPQAV